MPGWRGRVSGAVMYVACAVAVILLQSDPAAAQTRSIYVAPTTANFEGGAGTAGASIGLPKTGSPTFGVTFALPADYLTYGRVDIVFYLQRLGSPCTARFVLVHLARQRFKLPPSFSLEGLTPVGGNTVDFVSGEIVPKVLRLRRSSFIPQQRPGDLFYLAMGRQPGDPSDTCADTIYVNGININHPVAP